MKVFFFWTNTVLSVPGLGYFWLESANPMLKEPTQGQGQEWIIIEAEEIRGDTEDGIFVILWKLKNFKNYMGWINKLNLRTT